MLPEQLEQLSAAAIRLVRLRAAHLRLLAFMSSIDTVLIIDGIGKPYEESLPQLAEQYARLECLYADLTAILHPPS